MENISKNDNKITVVTVVYNDKTNIENTIKSVISQTYENIEYIVIDGLSTDGTKEIIQKYEDRINQYISEKDKGIYDAMNKSIDIASGKWIIFMNSGDYFYSKNTLSEIIKNKDDNSDIIYGNFINPEDKNEIKPRTLDQFWKGMPFNHQSTLTKTDLYKKRKYDLQYSISSVYDFYYYYYKNKAIFQYLDMPIAYYNFNGISALSFKWFPDYWKINLKYSSDKIFNIIFRIGFLFLVRLKYNIKILLLR